MGEITVSVDAVDADEVRRLLHARRLDGITFRDNLAWWRWWVRFWITGPQWALEQLPRQIRRIEEQRFEDML